ncbi:serine hydrolase domain-containing protein [Paenibacillus assamensis]|uniref:serine hydrolase domain-containing protein n=1 Tax=Paenibacillus assamensis TaxID=311244 RepID=UPI0003FD39B1|nr:serine hydrolase [Paenibacillus assamensis]
MRRMITSLISINVIALLASCTMGDSGTTRLKPTITKSIHHGEANDKAEGSSWKFISPDEAGFNMEALDTIKLRVESMPIYAMVVVKDGSIVDEYYREGYDANTRFPINSVTKSITSALVGIALQEKLIEGADDLVADYFPRWKQDSEPRNDKMTIRHLLTMSTGLDWPEWSEWDYGVEPMLYSSDWVSFVLNRPMAEIPGKKFNYNTGASQLLSAIIHKQYGESLQTYANRKLFEPLGIRDVFWLTGPNQMSAGGLGMEMIPRDMAKFGQLYLNGGEWEGHQIVPKIWVTHSTSKQSKGSTWFGNYGYHWWVRSIAGFQAYFAMGHAGQYIFVVPEKKLVLVFTSNLEDSSALIPYAEEIVEAAY